jgi:Xaa-Pro dipeptidase
METKATLAERDERYARIRERMAERELDGLLLGAKGHWWTGRGYARYLADFHLWGHDGMLLLPHDAEPAMTVNSYAVARLIAERGWISDTRGDVFVAPRIADAVEERGLARGRLGLVGGFVIPIAVRDALAERLPHAELVPADDVVDTVRMTKSEVEIAQNYELWALAKAAMERFAEVLRPGASQLELAAESSRVALAGGARDILILMGESNGRQAPPEDVPLRCDDVLRYHMEICGASGHWCELTITFAFRPPSDREAQLMETELRALEAVQAAARPGTRVSELGAVFERTVREDGWTIGPPSQHFDFHGQGMDVIELPWFAHEQPWGSAGDRELAAGSILSYHPARNVVPAVAWTPGVSDNLLVTEDGGRRLSGDWSHRWREVAA